MSAYFLAAIVAAVIAAIAIARMPEAADDESEG
jgi:hypothetical protein